MEKPSQSPLEALCDELLLQIVSHLDAPDVLTLRKTSRRLANVSADSFGDSFFACLKTDLSLRSLARLSAIARLEHIRRRVRVLHISPFPWLSTVSAYGANGGGGPARKKGWFRDADGRLDLTAPTAVSLLTCIRDGFPCCRSFVIDDKGWGSYHPYRRPDWQDYHPPNIPSDLVMMYPTDALAIVLALAADPANPSPVQSLRLCFTVGPRVGTTPWPIHEHLLRPDAVRRGNWDGLHTFYFSVYDHSLARAWNNEGGAIPFSHTDAFIHSLLREARNLETFEFGGNRGAIIEACIDALCQPERRRSPTGDSIRHLTITGSNGRNARRGRHYVSPVRLEKLFSQRYGGGKLESLCLKNIFLRRSHPDDEPLPRVLSRIREASPNLRTFVLERRPERGYSAADSFYICPLFKRLTRRLGSPASHDCLRGHDDDNGGCCRSSFSDEHGGTFQFASATLQRHDQGKLYEFSVRYERGDTGTAEGMDWALGDIAQAICYGRHILDCDSHRRSEMVLAPPGQD